MNIDRYARIQRHLRTEHMFPSLDGVCACGCGKKLQGRQRRWAEPDHGKAAYYRFSIIKGVSHIVRHAVFDRDQGFCRGCGLFDEKWEADHILPVEHGGGGCGLENYQTLCPTCHRAKTREQMRCSQLAQSS